MADIILSEILDTARYGWEFEGVSNYPNTLTGSFQGGGDKTLRFRGFDVDNSIELEVFLNDASIGFAPRARGVIGPEVNIAIPEADQLPGENIIRWQKSSIGDSKWGVTDIQLVAGAVGAVLVLRQADDPGASTGGDWRAGEIVAVVPDDHQFAFREMPVNDIGVLTVAQVNGFDPASIPLYAGVKMADAGTITIGAQGPLVVAQDDVIVWHFSPDGEYWVNHGDQTIVPANFGHIRISNRTAEETRIYLERFNKKLEYQSDQFDPETDLRRFTTTNVRVSATGKNGFTAQGIADALAEWNDSYPDNQVTLVDTDNLTYFQCDGIIPVDLYDEWRETSQRFALLDYYRRRRWYITQAGLDALAANEWVLNGEAADVAPFLRDGLLD